MIDGFSFQGRKIYLPRIDDHVIPCNIRRPLYRIRPLILPIPNTHFTETTNNLRLIILTAPKQCLLVTLIAGFCGLPPHYNVSQLNQPLYEFMVGKNPKDFVHEDMGAKNIFKYFKTYTYQLILVNKSFKCFREFLRLELRTHTQFNPIHEKMSVIYFHGQFTHPSYPPCISP